MLKPKPSAAAIRRTTLLINVAMILGGPIGLLIATGPEVAPSEARDSAVGSVDVIAASVLSMAAGPVIALGATEVIRCRAGSTVSSAGRGCDRRDAAVAARSVLSVVADGLTEPALDSGDGTEGCGGAVSEDDEGVPVVADGSVKPALGSGDGSEDFCGDGIEDDEDVPVVADGSTEPALRFRDEDAPVVADASVEPALRFGDEGVPVVAEASTEPALGPGDDTEGFCADEAEDDVDVPVSAEATPTPELTAMASPTLTVKAPERATSDGKTTEFLRIVQQSDETLADSRFCSHAKINTSVSRLRHLRAN